ncbi:MAG: PspC domain-containing protein [Oligoflexia bacterium]|nr:PspC domain-containing protein [Oligoflexia bacterium]
MSEKKRLCKSKSNKFLSGCLGGLAEYLGWDPTILRIVYVTVSIFSAAFPGIILYLTLMIVMPSPDEE